MYCNNPYLNRRDRQPSWTSAFNGLDKQLGSLFAELPSLFEFGDGSPVGFGGYAAGTRWSENETEFAARIDLPGVDPKDTQLTFEDRRVQIEAKRVFEAEAGKEGDAPTKTYRFALSVPDGVDVESISARSANGVLTITLPKLEKVRPRRIEVG